MDQSKMVETIGLMFWKVKTRVKCDAVFGKKKNFKNISVCIFLI